MFSNAPARPACVSLLLLCLAALLCPAVGRAQPAAPPVATDGEGAQPPLPTLLYLPMLASDPQREAVGVSDRAQAGGARGYLATPQELRAIRERAERGVEPHAANVRALLRHDDLADPSGWEGSSSIDGRPFCSDGSQGSNGKRIPRGPRYLVEGGRRVYAKMLAAHLSDDADATAYARDARARILDLTDTTNWGGRDLSADNQCVLYLSWYVTGFIMAADLLEEFPTIWTSGDKRQFQQWLASEVYPKAAWASRVRTNNWGSGGSYAAAMIADYLWDSGLTLEEQEPRALRLSPAQAYREHTAEQLSRMSTRVAPRDREDSRCLPRKGIQPSGGIPDELRRAKIDNPLGMCDAEYLPRIDGGYSSAYAYQMTHVEALIAHAELALRRGDRSLYDNVAADGSGSILRAITFVIANPKNPGASYQWDEYRLAMLYVAYRYYRDPAIAEQLSDRAPTLRSGEIISYGQLTHALAPGEEPTPPLPPPGAQELQLEHFLTSGGSWAMRDGALVLSGPARSDAGRALANTAVSPQAALGDLVLTARVRAHASRSAWNDVALIFSYRDARNYAYVSLNERNDQWTSGVFVVADGVATEVADIPTSIRTEVWYVLELRKAGAGVTVLLDGRPLATTQHPAFGDGQIGVGSRNDAASFASITLSSGD